MLIKPSWFRYYICFGTTCFGTKAKHKVQKYNVAFFPSMPIYPVICDYLILLTIKLKKKDLLN